MALIYIVEDDKKIAELLADYLHKAAFEVRKLYCGEHAIAQIVKDKPDLVILDVVLPGISGYCICNQLRAIGYDVPIIMLTGRTDEAERLKGLELGADDFICKPFFPSEVVARVKTILRRASKQQIAQQQRHNALVTYRNLTLDSQQMLCFVSGDNVELTPVELRMLHTLVMRPRHIFSRESLMQQCYDDQRIINNRTIDSHMRNLRKKLNGAESLIHTIYGVGYKLE